MNGCCMNVDLIEKWVTRKTEVYWGVCYNTYSINVDWIAEQMCEERTKGQKEMEYWRSGWIELTRSLKMRQGM